MKIYKLYNGMGQQFVVDVERNAFIPFDQANTDYQAFKLALTQGAVLQDADGVEIDNKTFLGTLK